VSEFEVADANFVCQRYGPVNQRGGCGVIVRMDAAIVQIREAHEEAPEQEATDVGEGQDSPCLSLIDGLEAIWFVSQSLFKHTQPRGVSGKGHRAAAVL
jgi:hypothetical protein